MLQLLSLIIALLTLFSMPARAAEGLAGFDFILTNQKGSIDFFRPNNRQKTKGYLSRFNLQLPTLKNYWTLSFSADLAKKDYSNFLLRDEDGKETPLSRTFDQKEYAMNLSAIYQKGKNSYTALVARSFGSSPFSFLAGSFAYNRSLLNKKRSLGFRLSSITKDQPASTYIDPTKNLETKNRPRNLTSFRYEANWSEVLNAKWKVNTLLFFGTRKKDRPHHYGVEIRNGVGLSNELTFRVHTGFLNEATTELKDDRGRFSVLWLEGSFYWEFQYDFSLEASYSFVREKENYEDNRGITALGTDSYGLKLNYEGVGWLLNVSYILRNTNTDYQSHTFQGGIKWII